MLTGNNLEGKHFNIHTQNLFNFLYCRVTEPPDEEEQHLKTITTEAAADKRNTDKNNTDVTSNANHSEKPLNNTNDVKS